MVVHKIPRLKKGQLFNNDITCLLSISYRAIREIYTKMGILLKTKDLSCPDFYGACSTRELFLDENDIYMFNHLILNGLSCPDLLKNHGFVILGMEA